jgi:hypothetical protein
METGKFEILQVYVLENIFIQLCLVAEYYLSEHFSEEGWGINARIIRVYLEVKLSYFS